MKPICLDLFSGAGGCTKGYQDAGFYVVGIDNRPQPRYCGDDFLQADALEVLRILADGECIIGQSGRVYHLADFDLIAASPPCQLFSEATPMRYRSNHPDLIDPIRQLLRMTGKPYVIENVTGAAKKLISPIMLCGTMFGLPIWRHRYFETWPELFCLLPPCAHIGSPVLVTGLGSKRDKQGKRNKKVPIAKKRQAMEIDWMTCGEITEAIPPVYTRWLGQQMLELIREAAQ